MDPFVAQVTHALGALTVFGDLAVLAIAFSMVFHKRGDWALPRFLARHAVPFAFAVSFAAFLGSIFYSEIAGFPPCALCWLQRAFMYPQVLLLGVALLRHDRRILDYVLILSFAGAALAGYNQYLQFGGIPLVPCGIAPGTVSCSQRFFLEFGYVTIPMMSLTAFALVASVIMGGRVHARRA